MQIEVPAASLSISANHFKTLLFQREKYLLAVAQGRVTNKNKLLTCVHSVVHKCEVVVDYKSILWHALVCVHRAAKWWGGAASPHRVCFLLAPKIFVLLSGIRTETIILWGNIFKERRSHYVSK